MNRAHKKDHRANRKKKKSCGRASKEKAQGRGLKSSKGKHPASWEFWERDVRRGTEKKKRSRIDSVDNSIFQERKKWPLEVRGCLKGI